MIAETVNLFLRPDRKIQKIHAGECYRHVGPGELVETAKVIEIRQDPMGIAHVRYEVMVQRTKEHLARVEDLRTLNLITFSTYFSEQVEA